MNQFFGGYLRLAVAAALTACAFLPASASAQTSSRSDQWIHVRVESKENKGEMVRVNVPVDMAAKVLPAINHDKLHDGKVHIEAAHMDDVDLHALLDAVRTAKDGEYVTVQSKENDVRVAKNGGYLYVHVRDKEHAANSDKAADSKESPKVAKESTVEIKVPMKVVDALFSAGKDELDLVAALHALSGNGDMELVTVKDNENTVRVWIDSKNIAD